MKTKSKIHRDPLTGMDDIDSFWDAAETNDNQPSVPRKERIPKKPTIFPNNLETNTPKTSKAILGIAKGLQNSENTNDRDFFSPSNLSRVSTAPPSASARSEATNNDDNNLSPLLENKSLVSEVELSANFGTASSNQSDDIASVASMENAAKLLPTPPSLSKSENTPEVEDTVHDLLNNTLNSLEQDSKRNTSRYVNESHFSSSSSSLKSPIAKSMSYSTSSAELEHISKQSIVQDGSQNEIITQADEFQIHHSPDHDSSSSMDLSDDVRPNMSETTRKEKRNSPNNPSKFFVSKSAEKINQQNRDFDSDVDHFHDNFSTSEQHNNNNEILSKQKSSSTEETIDYSAQISSESRNAFSNKITPKKGKPKNKRDQNTIRTPDSARESSHDLDNLNDNFSNPHIDDNNIDNLTNKKSTSNHEPVDYSTEISNEARNTVSNITPQKKREIKGKGDQNVIRTPVSALKSSKTPDSSRSKHTAPLSPDSQPQEYHRQHDQLLSGDDDDKEGPGFQLADTEEQIKKEKRPKKKKMKSTRSKVTPSPSARHVTFSNEFKGYAVGNRDYEIHPLSDFGNNNESNDGLRRSSRARVKPLAFWKNERMIYSASETDGKPEVSGVMTALDTPMKRRIVTHYGEDAGRHRPKRSRSETVKSNIKKFDDTKLRKKYDFMKEGEDTARIWDEELNDISERKIVAIAKNMKETKLPCADREKDESKVVGKAGQGFNIRNFNNIPGWISGFLNLPPQGIKDAEGVGLCSQVFFVHQCQPNSLQIALADPDDEEFDNHNAQRFLLSPGDSFHIPPNNVYRIENHSKDTECKLFWTIVRPV